MKLGGTLAALAAALLIAAAGCGGGGDDEEELSRPQTVARVEAICGRFLTAFEAERAKVDPQDPATEVAFAAKGAEIRAGMVAALDELEPAPERQQRFEEFLDGQRDASEAQRRLAAAVERLSEDDSDENARAVRQALEDTIDAVGRSERAAVAYGIDECSASSPEELEAQGTEARATADGDRVVAGSGFVGTWTGDVTQHGPGDVTDTYPVAMTINVKPGADGTSGTISYPSYPCSGSVEILHAAGDPRRFVGYKYVIHERIDVNRAQCAAGATIVVYQQGTGAIWHWRKGSINAIGILQRSDAEPPPAREEELDEVDDAALLGRWVGVVDQYGPGGVARQFHADVDVGRQGVPGGGELVDGHVSYDHGDCGGTLALTGERSFRYTFEERITTGGCFDGGTLTLAADQRSLSYYWSGESGGDPVEAFGFLHAAG